MLAGDGDDTIIQRELGPVVYGSCVSICNVHGTIERLYI